MFSDDYLARCRQMSPDEIVRFLEDFRRIHASQPARSRPINIRIPEDLLAAFKTKAGLDRVPYQTKIKELMKAWLLENGERSP